MLCKPSSRGHFIPLADLLGLEHGSDAQLDVEIFLSPRCCRPAGGVPGIGCLACRCAAMANQADHDRQRVPCGSRQRHRLAHVPGGRWRRTWPSSRFARHSRYGAAKSARSIPRRTTNGLRKAGAPSLPAIQPLPKVVSYLANKIGYCQSVKAHSAGWLWVSGSQSSANERVGGASKYYNRIGGNTC